MRRLLAALLLLAGPAFADSPFDWQQHPGQPLPLAQEFHDESGAAIPFRALFQGVPVILDLGYFQCPSLCGVARADLFNALAESGLQPGADYEVAAISIDPSETPDIAHAAKAKDLAAFPTADAAARHYLTGTADAIAAVSAAVGFRARWDGQWSQWYHPTGLVLVTPDGTISSYLQGVGYSPGDLRTAIIRARSGGIAQAALPILLLCFHYDPVTGRYDLVITKLLRLMGVLTVITLAGLFFILNRHPRSGA